MGKTLYLECASGISGDMVVASLLDLGANEDGLRRALASLGVDGFDIAVSRKSVSGIDACDFDVVLDEAHESHDHDMAYLYGGLDEDDTDHGHRHDGVDGEHHHCHGHDGGDAHDHVRHYKHKKGKAHKRGHKHAHGKLSHEHVQGHEDPHVHEHPHDHEDSHEHHHGPGHPRDHEHGNENPHVHGHVDGHGHVHSHDHVHDIEHQHPHDHNHAHHHGDNDTQGQSHVHAHGHTHHHEHRSPADIAAIIDAADLAPRARELAHRIFDIVAEAEAKAHGLSIEEVHFHEVGAVDSIVDVVAAAYCLDDLDVSEAIVSPLAEGRGRVRCAHGVLPVPVPAVLNIATAHGLALEQRDQPGELVTPTGAAIAAAVRTRDALPAAYRVCKVGIGAGKRAYNPPSTVRALIIEEVEPVRPDDAPAPQETGAEAIPSAEATVQTAADDTLAMGAGLGTPHLWKLETEVDDCTGEALGYTMQLLYDAGALEVHYLPVFMKKNRPGYQIEVLCRAADIPTMEAILFTETTTIGVRRCPEWRSALERTADEVQTALGAMRVKQVVLPSGAIRRYLEHDSVAEMARTAGISYQEALRAGYAALEG